jgi:hypothetical protein
MTPEQQICENAALIVTECGPISGLGPGFGYNRQSVQWLDGYIERIRADGRFSPDQTENMSQLFACFLGECIRATYGGEWRERDGTWGVLFKNSSGAFPFGKVRKQFESGNDGGESILGFFDVLPEILSGRIHQRPFMGWLRSILRRLVR